MIIETIQYWLCMMCLNKGRLAPHFISLQLYIQYRLQTEVMNNKKITSFHYSSCHVIFLQTTSVQCPSHN
jgi:hypothetical protein